MTALQFYTATYQRFQPSMGIPIRTTVGAPRFALTYRLAGNWKSVTPDVAAFRANLSEEQFRQVYRGKLDSAGLDRLMAEAAMFLTPNGDNRLVLLCFDDLTKPGNWCHRTMLGEWMTEQGVPVIELFPGSGERGHAPPGGPAIPPQPALF